MMLVELGHAIEDGAFHMPTSPPVRGLVGRDK
jgi:hypothetical protein